MKFIFSRSFCDIGGLYLQLRLLFDFHIDTTYSDGSVGRGWQNISKRNKNPGTMKK